MTLILVVSTGLLGALLFHQWNQPAIPDDAQGVVDKKPAKSTPASDRVSPIRPFRALPISNYAEIMQRPLFAEGRVPPEKPDNSGAKRAPRSPLNLKLEGVAITPDSKTAVILDLTTKELLRLREGMSHKDWKVVSVSNENVVIKQGKQEVKLTLEIDAGNTPLRTKPKLPFKRSGVRKRPLAVPNQ
jgi:hypothetical protein